MKIEVTRFGGFYIDGVHVAGDDHVTLAEYREISRGKTIVFTPACWRVTPIQVEAGKKIFLGRKEK
jgi:uncharacterized protein YndB with AHSA1/START domain